MNGGAYGTIGRMWKGLAHAGAWTMATGAAMAMSWFGVHHVLAGTVYDPPRALPITEQVAATAVPDGPAKRTTAPPSASPSSASPSASASPSGPVSASSTPERPRGSGSAAATYAAGTTGQVHSYPVEGGRVTLDLGESAATLVSATPEPGWEMKVWTQDGWIRVDFTSTDNATTSSVFCTWNGHPPTVQTYVAGG